MKKLLFLLFLLPFMAMAQVSTGQEQYFDYGIKNNSSQKILTPDTLVTKGADGTYGHTSAYRLPVSTATQAAIDVKVASNAGLQNAYNFEPKIVTSAIKGAVTIRRGSAADSDTVLSVQNGAGTVTASISGNGNIVGGTYNGYTPESTSNKQNSLAVDGTGVKFPTVDAVNASKYTYYVEDYRNNSVYESIWLQSLINSSPENATFVFKNNTTYTLNNALVPKKGQIFKGNGATIKRANESKTTLSASLLSTNSSFTVTSVPADWKINDYLHVFVGTSYNQSSQIVKIQNISGTTITLTTQILGYVGSESTPITYPNGAGVRKVFNLFDGVQYPIAKPFVIDGVKFDGNKANNASNYYWALNGMINVFGYGGQVSNCFFKDVPNENITTSGAKISNNYSENLNGSFVHFSSPPVSLGENIQGTIVTNNLAINTNLINPSTTNHSVSPLEISWNPGKSIISNNYFYGTKNGAVAYNFHLQNDLDDLTDRDELIISGNIFKNFSGISEFVSSDMSKVKSRLITGNIFVDCGFNNFNGISGSSIKFFNNQYSGDTSVSGLKQDITEIPTFLNKTKTTSSDDNLVASFSGLDKDGGVWLGSNSFNEGIINGYNNAGDTPSDLSFQRFSSKISKFFNRVLINTDADDMTTELQVNGEISATTYTGNVTGNVTGTAGNSSSWNFLPRTAGNIPTPNYVVSLNSDGSNAGNTSLTQLKSVVGESIPLTGTPTAPTATAGTNTTQVATTAFVQSALRPYKVYTALLTQTGTNAPVATVLENTLGGTIVWTRNNTGQYNGTLTNAFTTDKTWVGIMGIGTLTQYTAAMSAYRQNVDVVRIDTTLAGGFTDAMMTSVPIEIRVYN